MEYADYKEEFYNLYHTYVTRPGADALLKFLEEKSDFFTAPASTRFHLACEGGLLQHSVNVAREMLKWEDEAPESLAVCGLLHDLCKVNYYKVSLRNSKNDQTGKWEKVPFYQVEDRFPYGHGEKSVYMIERFFRLKTAEAVAIRWHMGGFDDAVKGGSFAISRAYETYPLAVKLHLADVTATYLVETRA
mgnify:CR=1 FL=1